jgi:trehalose 6-phosphate synthase/phosphatase
MLHTKREVEMDLDGDFCCFHVRVKCQTRRGQSVAISGTSLAFQSADFAAIPLVTTPEAYPIWYSNQPIVIPRGEIVKYKYCLIEGGKIKAHEQSSTPRRLLPEDAVMEIEDEFDLTYLEGSRSEIEADILDQSKNIKNTVSEGDLAWRNIGKRHCRLFLVCYHLPVLIKRTGRSSDPFEVSWSESLIAKSEDSVSQSLKTIWIGTLSVSDAELTTNEKDYLLSVLHGMDCFPVFLDSELATDAYYGFCKTVMWPVFHNVDQLDHIHAAWNLPPDYYEHANNNRHVSGLSTVTNPPNRSRSRSGSRVFDAPVENKVLEWNRQEAALHMAFKRVNEIFTASILDLVRPGDIVWVHDYHLMYVPSMLRHSAALEQKSAEHAFKILFFLHIPFPTSQIFRTLPEATLLLQSLLCADLVGFHAFDHARHFLNASRRMLGFRSHTRPGGMLSIAVKDREVIVTMSHVSIETPRFDTQLLDAETQRAAEALREKYKGKKVILGIDVCQRLSGLALKFAAFEKFIADYGASNVVLLQRCIRQGSRPEDEETTSADCKKMVADLNAKYTGVVDYEEVLGYKGVNLSERVALYLLADVFLITPIREGLNFLPLEYLYTRKALPKAGCVVASEFSTCSSVLNGSLKVNPFAPVSVSDALEKALGMSAKDMEYRLKRDLPFISSHPSSLWTKRILNELEQLQSQSGRGRMRALKLPEVLTAQSLRAAYQTAALRDGDLIPRAGRVFVFEYGGVLLLKEKFDIYIKQTLSAIAGRKPADSVMDVLRRLSDDPRNAVVVLTGLTRQKLGDTFASLPKVTLATSNGLVYSWGQHLLPAKAQARAVAGGANGDGRVWECMDCKVDWTAVADIAVPIITRFTFRTNGTCQTPRFPGIGWSFFGADPEWGQKQAAQLTYELEAALVSHDVKVTSLISGSIEVVPRTLNKGLLVSAVLNKVLGLRAGKAPGLVVVMSGEESDDGMMQAAYQAMGAARSQHPTQAAKVFTLTVGKRESPAQYYVNDVNDVEALLRPLVSDAL